MVCTYGYGIIYFENSGQVFKNYIEEFVSKKFDENNLQEYEVNDWLVLYKNPTVSAYGRSVLKHPDANNYDWGMPEELKGVKGLKRGELTSNSKTEIQNAGGKAVVNMTSNNLYTDAEDKSIMLAKKNSQMFDLNYDFVFSIPVYENIPSYEEGDYVAFPDPNKVASGTIE